MNKIYNFLGLIQKSGNLSSGDDTVLFDIKKGLVKLIIISDDASENTRKKFTDIAKSKHISYVIFGDKNEIGYAIGKSPRSVLGIKNSGFATAFKEKTSKMNNGGGSIVKG